MYCPNCGSECLENAQYCSECGTDIHRIRENVQANESISTQPGGDATSGPKGVGGWLLLYCIGLVILGPLVTIVRMSTNWEESQPVFDIIPSFKSAIIIESIGVLAIMIAGFVAGIYIWRGAASGRRIARKYLKGRLFGFIALEVLVFLVVLGDLPDQAMSTMVVSIIGTVIYEIMLFSVWWLYFTNSKRVRNTYKLE